MVSLFPPEALAITEPAISSSIRSVLMSLPPPIRNFSFVPWMINDDDVIVPVGPSP